MMKPSFAIGARAKEAYLKTILFQKSMTHDTFLTDVLAWETNVTAKPGVTYLPGRALPHHRLHFARCPREAPHITFLIPL